MDILIKITRSSSKNNNDQRGYSFRSDERGIKKSIPTMVSFCASVTVEILDIR